MRSTRWAALLLTISCGTTFALADDLTTNDGKKLTGKLVSVNGEGVSFTTAEATVTVPGRNIVGITLSDKFEPIPATVTTHSEIELTDGSVIRVAKFTIKGKKFETTLWPGAKVAAPTLDLPMSAVFTAMKKAEDAKGRAEWRKLVANRGKRDMYVIRQGQGLTFIQGTILGGTDDGKLEFEKEDKSTDKLLQSRSAGYVFHQAQPAAVPQTICRVLDVFGNTLNAASIKIATDGVTVTTVAGASIKYPSLAAIAKLDYSQGNVAYLSDLNPEVEMPDLPPAEKRLSPITPFLRDKSLSNEMIRLENATFPKGICIAPDTVLSFNLDGNYTQFKATVGIDENGLNATSAAKLIIEADGQVLFSETLKRKDKAKGLVLVVKGVKQLKVIVEADTPVNGNYVIMADARVQK
ncbi:MAG: NPCBM/NEW2 domain-containing protein [Planctomycetia bacterium]|nr:NPCBM/NEW2 domain-containing protein [Planctomycetia bacterium]